MLLLLFCQFYVEFCSFCCCGYGVDFDVDVEVVEVVVLWLLLWHVDDDLVVWKVCE